MDKGKLVSEIIKMESEMVAAIFSGHRPHSDDQFKVYRELLKVYREILLNGK